MIPTKQDVINFIDNWRTNNSAPLGSLDQAYPGGGYSTYAEKFLHDLNTEFNTLSITKPSGGEIMINYSGELSDGTKTWRVAENLETESGSKYYSIGSTDAGQLLNDQEVLSAIRDAVQDNPLYEKLLNGPRDTVTDVRSSYTYPNELSLWDNISREFVLRNYDGNSLNITPNAPSDGVWAQTEVAAKLESSAPTIDGIPRSAVQSLIDLSPDNATGYKAFLELLKNRSAVDIADIQVYTKQVSLPGGGAETQVVAVDYRSIDGTSSFTEPASNTYDAKVKASNYAGAATYDAILTKYPAFQSTYDQLLTSNPTEAARLMETLQVLDDAAERESASLTDKYPVNSELATNLRNPEYMHIRGLTLKALGPIGGVLLAVDFYNTLMHAKDLYNTGDHLGAAKMIDKWVIETGSGLATSIAVMETFMPIAAAISTIPILSI